MERSDAPRACVRYWRMDGIPRKYKLPESLRAQIIQFANDGESDYTYCIRGSVLPKMRDGKMLIDVYCRCSAPRSKKCPAVKKIVVEEETLSMELFVIQADHTCEPSQTKIKPIPEDVKLSIRQQAARHIEVGNIRQNLPTQFPGRT